MTTSAGSGAEYDYIVVGSGAGGGPLAANLAEGGYTVLLLEAGGDAEPYNYQVPLFHPRSSEDKEMRWDYFVRHYSDQERQSKDTKFTKEKDGVYYPRAGTLGGCTAHNAMVTVYPHNSDWDQLAQLTGDPTWQAGNMRKYFQRLENCHYRRVHRLLSKIGLNFTRHGFSGWLHTSYADPFLVLRDRDLLKVVAKAKVAAFLALRNRFKRILNFITSIGDPNDWCLVKQSAQGVRLIPLATDGVRRSSTRERIQAVQRALPNRLTVKINCLVVKIVLDENNTATGLEFQEGEKLYRADRDYQEVSSPSETMTATARKEVILSCGAFNTPQLLMLSGIGPKDELDKHGIDVKVDLPGVGENLQDRYEVTVVQRMKEDFSLLDGVTLAAPEPGQDPDPSFKEWQDGKGLYTTNGGLLAVIKKSSPNNPEPDLFIFCVPGRFTGYFPGYSEEITKNYFTWIILKAHTRNRAGRVTLRTTDPRDVPEINFHYFDEGTDASQDDLKSTVSGVRFARTLTDSFRDMVDEEETPGPGVQTDEELEEFVKNEAWGHHASCTCKIGASDDPMAVVNGDFQVYGTKNLRVVDASIFPVIPGFFIVSSVYMISEKASDVILAAAKR